MPNMPPVPLTPCSCFGRHGFKLWLYPLIDTGTSAAHAMTIYYNRTVNNQIVGP
jgi:hypothetical protein